MNERRISPGPLAVGVFLIVLGGALLLSQLDLLHVRGIGHLWPVLLIGLGVAKIFVPDREEGRWSGYWLLLVGLYCGASVWHWWGLSWRTSWPLMVIAGGVMIVAKAIFGTRRELPQKAGDAAGTDGRAS